MHVPSPFVAVALFYVICASIEGALFAEQRLTRRHERQPPQGQTLTVPTGDYQAYHLQLSAFPSAQLHRIRGVFRDGRSWVPGPASVRQQAGELQLNGNQIQGTLKWAKQAKGAAAIDLQAEIRAEVLGDGRIQGTWSCEGVEEQRGQQDYFRKQGELKGWLRSLAELQQNNAVHEQASWTSYMGSQHNMQAFDSDRELVDDLRQARLIWRSEDPIPTGQGNGVPFGRSSRVPRAVDHWSIGGGAGPVLLDGRIYVFYTQPVHAGPFRKPHIRLLADLYRQEFLKEEEKQQRKQAESPEDLLGGFGGLDLELEEDTPEKRKQDLAERMDLSHSAGGEDQDERMESFAEEQAALRKDLQALAKRMKQHAREAEDLLPEPSQQARSIADAIPRSGAPDLQKQATGSAQQGESQEAAQFAQEAADALAGLHQENEGLEGSCESAAGACNQMGGSEAMNSIQQMIDAMRAQRGSQPPNGPMGLSFPMGLRVGGSGAGMGGSLSTVPMIGPNFPSTGLSINGFALPGRGQGELSGIGTGASGEEMEEGPGTVSPDSVWEQREAMSIPEGVPERFTPVIRAYFERLSSDRDLP